MKYEVEVGEEGFRVDAATQARYEPIDARRREELIALVHFLSRCQICGTKLKDATLDVTPGVCGNQNCRRRARRDRKTKRSSVNVQQQ